MLIGRNIYLSVHSCHTHIPVSIHPPSCFRFNEPVLLSIQPFPLNRASAAIHSPIFSLTSSQCCNLFAHLFPYIGPVLQSIRPSFPLHRASAAVRWHTFSVAPYFMIMQAVMWLCAYRWPIMSSQSSAPVQRRARDNVFMVCRVKGGLADKKKNNQGHALQRACLATDMLRTRMMN